MSNNYVKTPSAGSEELLGDLVVCDDWSAQTKIAYAHALAALSTAYSVDDAREKMSDLVVEVQELRGAVEEVRESIDRASVPGPRYTVWEFIRELLSGRRRV